MPVHAIKMGVLGILMPKWGVATMIPPKGTFLHRNALQDILIVKIGLPVWAGHEPKNRKRSPKKPKHVTCHIILAIGFYDNLYKP